MRHVRLDEPILPTWEVHTTEVTMRLLCVDEAILELLVAFLQHRVLEITSINLIPSQYAPDKFEITLGCRTTCGDS